MNLGVFPNHYVEGLLFSSALECVVRVCGKRCLSPQHHEHGSSCYLFSFFLGGGGKTNTDKNNKMEGGIGRGRHDWTWMDGVVLGQSCYERW
jgi:hypothetical protein